MNLSDIVLCIHCEEEMSFTLIHVG